MIVAVLAALAAGVCFSFAGLLQQRAASARPSAESLSVRLLVSLARQRLWLAGIGLAVLSYGFQSLALAFGPLSVVQPLIVTELLFALPISARMQRMRLTGREWLGGLAVGLGLAAALALAAPTEGDPRVALSKWTWALVAVGAIVVLALLVARRVHGPTRASLFALAAGTLLGVQSALLKASIARLEQGVGPLLASWETYGLVAASLGGLLLVQSAYQAGPLAASMPVIDAAEPLVAIAIGLAVFGESLPHPAWRRAVAAGGMAAVVVGIGLLDSSPIIKRLHARERSLAE